MTETVTVRNRVPVGEGKKYHWLRTEKGRAYIKRHNRNGAERTARYRANHREEYLERHKEQQRLWRASTRGKRMIKNNALMKSYGMSIEEFDSLVASQDGKCAICQSTLRMGKSTAVDHDHATGKVRGVLCSQCNTALGQFREDPRIIGRAIEYLKGRK